jgi:putative FmdB family regulatory protein
MPLYDFQCVSCGQQEEHFCAMVERDLIELACFRCGKRLRRMVSAPAYHGEPYQMGVVLGDGTRVKGHFGKEARLLKRS